MNTDSIMSIRSAAQIVHAALPFQAATRLFARANGTMDKVGMTVTGSGGAINTVLRCASKAMSAWLGDALCASMHAMASVSPMTLAALNVGAAGNTTEQMAGKVAVAESIGFGMRGSIEEQEFRRQR